MSDIQKLGTTNATIPFPRLRELKGKHRITFQKLSEIMGVKSHQTAFKKLNDGSFTIYDMVIITEFFNSLGETETVNSLFFSWISQMRN